MTSECPSRSRVHGVHRNDGFAGQWEVIAKTLAHLHLLAASHRLTIMPFQEQCCPALPLTMLMLMSTLLHVPWNVSRGRKIGADYSFQTCSATLLSVHLRALYLNNDSWSLVDRMIGTLVSTIVAFLWQGNRTCTAAGVRERDTLLRGSLDDLVANSII